jgi:hypothetical protein
MQNPYAKFLGERDPLASMAATPGAIYALLASPLAENPTLLDKQPAPGKWSIREILVHLADCELAFGFRLRQGVASPQVTMQPWDQEIWAERAGAYDAATALSTFTVTRNWNMLFLKTVTPQEWAAVVTHPERGAGPLRIVLETIAGHDLNHLEQIERLASPVL